MIRSLRLDAGKFKLLFGISFEDPLAFLPLPIQEAHKDTARLTPASAESSFIRRAGRWYDAMPHSPSIWGAMCNKLVEMRGLRILRMNIIGEYFPGLISEPGSSEEAWGLAIFDESFILQPLARARAEFVRRRQLQVFDLKVNWASNSVIDHKNWGLNVTRSVRQSDT